MNKISVLILSSTIDYSTDLVCYELEKRKVEYLRLDRDEFCNYKIIYNLDIGNLSVIINGVNYSINKNELKSIYFRAPIYIRAGKTMTIEDQLSKGQWNAFLRNLIIFDDAKWINNPVSTFYAENKLMQLETAKKIGLKIPITFVGNVIPSTINRNSKYIVKSLDTALFYDGKDELFSYTNVVTGEELLKSELTIAPVIIQEFLDDKIDLRVTIIENKIFVAKVLSNDNGIYGDWRTTKKEDLQYIATTLPKDIESKLFRFMKEMDLLFSGIDFALIGEDYYFIESNPTGEWGWLKRTAKFDIDLELVNALLKE